MTVLPFLVVATLAGSGSLVLRASRGWSTAIAVAGLLGMVATAAGMSPSATIEIGGTVLAGSAWLRLYALLGSIVGLGLIAIDVTAMHEPDVPGVIVIGLGTAVLALAIPNAGVAVMAATAGGLAGVLVAAPVGAAARAAFVGVRELRALAVAGTLAILATAWLARPLGDLAAQPAVFGLAYLAFGSAVAIRFGAIPFHLWAARLADAAPGVALPLLMAWGPAAFAAVALVWIDQSVAPLVMPLSTERALIGAVGTVSIILGLLAAWIQDDLEHVVGYSIIADAGVAVLGLAALDPGAWEPARTWLLVFVVGRSAFAAWVVAIHGGFGTRRLQELAGWARRAPVLGISLVLIAIASIGWPGFVAWQARSTLIQLALPGLIGLLVTIAPIGAVAIYGRILLVGIGQPSRAVAEGRGERPRWPEREPGGAAPEPRGAAPESRGAAPESRTPSTRAARESGRPIAGSTGIERRLERMSQRVTGVQGGIARVSEGLAGRLDIFWVLPAGGRANRVPLAALAVLLLSGLAFLVAGGGLGVPEAARAIPEAVPGSGSGPTTPGASGIPGASELPTASAPVPGGPSFAPVP